MRCRWWRPTWWWPRWRWVRGYTGGRAAALPAARSRHLKLRLRMHVDPRKRQVRVMREAANPIARHGRLQPLDFRFDGLQRIKVEGRHPRRLDVGGGRHQIGQEAERPAAGRFGNPGG